MPFKLNPLLAKWVRGEIKIPPPVNIVNELNYSTWQNMKSRCYNSKTNGFKYYGGKGIKVCQRWLKNYQAFVNDMGNRPSINHSIDRIDTNKDYEPNNCRWLLKSENSKRAKTLP